MYRTNIHIHWRRGRRWFSRLVMMITNRPAFRVGVFIVCLAAIASLLLFFVERRPPNGRPAEEWPYSTYWGTVKQVGILLLSGYDAEQPFYALGYALTMFCAGLGIALLALLTADLASILVTVAVLRVGRRKVNASNHIVICGWHYATRELVAQLTNRISGTQRRIVVVDETTDKLPYFDPDVYLIQGDPTEEDVLKLASAGKSYTTLVPIDWDLPESLQDSRTTLAAMAVKSINDQVYVCAEVLKPHNRKHIERAGVDEVVCVGDLSEKLLCQAALTHGLAQVVNEMLTIGDDSEIRKIPLPDQLGGQSFRWVLRRLNKQHSAILLAVKRGDQVHANPLGEFKLAKGDDLYILARGGMGLLDDL